MEYSMMRVHNNTRLIIKALAEDKGVSMMTWLDDLVREQALEQGFIIKEKKKERLPKADVIREIELEVS